MRDIISDRFNNYSYLGPVCTFLRYWPSKAYSSWNRFSRSFKVIETTWFERHTISYSYSIVIAALYCTVLEIHCTTIY